MSPTADRAAAAMLRTWEYYAALNPVGMGRHLGGTTACVTTVPVPTLNGVYVATETVDSPVVRLLLDTVSTFGVPHCLQGRATSVSALTTVADDYHMTRSEDAPLMTLQDPDQLLTAQAVADLVVRELRPAEAHLHNAVSAAGFGAPLEMIDRLVPPELLAGPAVRVYAGFVEGGAVSTGMAITLDDTVGVFNVATVPAARGRGYGGAVTARLVADALRSGATLACLQSSPEGLGVYRRLGFEVVEWWPCWITPPAA